MRSTIRGNASIFALMLLATLAATAGVAFALYEPAQRAPTWWLSLAMLCVAEMLVFAFPIYHGRVAADSRAPAFVFGLGMQSTLVIYALGVVALCLLSGTGVVRYSLVERVALAEGVRLQSVAAAGRAVPVMPPAFDGATHPRLVEAQALAAGETDRFDISVTVQADAAAGASLRGCAAAGWSSRSELASDDGSTTGSHCLDGTPQVVDAGALVLRKSLLAAPAVAGPGLFQLKYRIEVHNQRWFMSFRTLAIAHTVWALGLFLFAGFWRMGSSHATGLATASRQQRVEFNVVRARVDALVDRMRRENEPALQPVVQAVRKLQDDIAFTTPESPQGTEDYTRELLARIERLSAVCAESRVVARNDGPSSPTVASLLEDVQGVADLVRERAAAVKAAR